RYCHPVGISSAHSGSLLPWLLPFAIPNAVISVADGTSSNEVGSTVLARRRQRRRRSNPNIDSLSSRYKQYLFQPCPLLCHPERCHTVADGTSSNEVGSTFSFCLFPWLFSPCHPVLDEI